MSLYALLHLLAAHSADGQDTACLAFRHPALTRDHRPVLLSGPLRSLCGLIAEELAEGEKAVNSAPFNFWPRDRSWFALTDWDGCGTKVSGPRSLIDAILADTDLEAVACNAAEVGGPAANDGHDGRLKLVMACGCPPIGVVVIGRAVIYLDVHIRRYGA